VFAASDWAIELKLLMATIDRRLVAETSLLDIFLLSHSGLVPSEFGTYQTVKATYKTVKATYKTVKAIYKTVKAR